MDSAPDSMPSDIADGLRSIGAVIDPAATAALYAPLHRRQAPKAVDRDRVYGTHERHRLDIFRPEIVGHSLCPIVVFVHGGGFTRGAKSQPGSPFYDNVMQWLASAGFVGVNMNYRLAPEHQWPSGIEDLTLVLDWVRNHAEQVGGNSEHVVLWGHSAGAAHVGDYVAARFQSGQSAGVAGAVLTSGFFDLGDEVSPWQAYYGVDVSLYPERSSLAGLSQSSVPLLINDAELDPAVFQDQARLLVQARAGSAAPTRYVRLAGHSHISETYAIGTDDDMLSAEVAAFVRSVQP